MKRSVVVLSILFTCFGALGVEPHRCIKNGKPVITNLLCEDIGAVSEGASLASPPVIAANLPQLSPVRIVDPGIPKLPTQDSTPNSTFIWVALLIVIGVLARLFFTRTPGGYRAREPQLAEPPLEPREHRVQPEPLPYKPAALMSKYELAFFERLREALPECEVFPQVPLAGFIEIDRLKAGADISTKSYAWQNRIGQQRVDFLVCRRENMEIVSAVELDDPSHDSPEATARDRKKSESLEAAGVLLLRWRVEAMPTIEEIREQFYRVEKFNSELRRHQTMRIL